MSKVADIQLRQDVLDELDFDPRIEARTIGVIVEDGIVTLTGYVATYGERVAAERVVKHVAGVEGVANELGVRLAVNAERNDADIARAAVHALAWMTTVPKDRVKVSVTRGWLTLDGTVEWHYQKEAAEEAVRDLTGVRGVSNKVNVESQPARNGDVKERIEKALKRNAKLDASRVIVETGNGTVTLRGEVRTLAEHQAALDAAWSAPGVMRVIDLLAVVSEFEPVFR